MFRLSPSLATPILTTNTWVGFFLPAGTPQALVDRINAEINKAMESPESLEKFAALGMESTRNTSAEFSRFLRDEVGKWAAVVKSTGAKVDWVRSQRQASYYSA